MFSSATTASWIIAVFVWERAAAGKVVISFSSSSIFPKSVRMESFPGIIFLNSLATSFISGRKIIIPTKLNVKWPTAMVISLFAPIAAAIVSTNFW